MITKESSLTELANHFGSDKGTAKGDWGVAHGYTEIYERLLAPRRYEPLRVLELGVWRGASLQMWENFLPNAQIIGVDNLPDVAVRPLQRAQVLVGDATDPEFLRTVLSRFPDNAVDLIIDDASHLLEHQIASFQFLFRYLAAGGVYIVEDTSGSRFEDWNLRTTNFVDFFDYASTLATQTTFFAEDTVEILHSVQDQGALSSELKKRLTGSYYNQHLRSVLFFCNVCALEKRIDPLQFDPAIPVDLALQPREGPLFRANKNGNVASNPLSAAPAESPSETLPDSDQSLIALQLRRENASLQQRLNLVTSQHIRMSVDHRDSIAENKELQAKIQALEFCMSELRLDASAANTNSPSARLRESAPQTDPASQDFQKLARKGLKTAWDLVFRLQAEVGSLRPLLKDAQAELGSLRLRNDDAKVLQAQLAARSSELAALEQSRLELETRLKVMETALPAAEAIRTQLEVDNRQLREVLKIAQAELGTARAQAFDVASMQAQLTARNLELAGIEQSRYELLLKSDHDSNRIRAQLEGKQSELAAAHSSIAALQAELAAVESIIASVQSSKSWLLTKPLRALSAIFSRR